TITRPVSLEKVAQSIGVSTELLRYLNPVYKRAIVPASDAKPYSLIMPMNKVNTYIANADRIYQESGNYMPNIPVSNVSLIDKNGRGEYTVDNDETADNNETRTIQVVKAKKGENIQQLAKKYSCSVPELRKLNRLHVNQLK